MMTPTRFPPLGLTNVLTVIPCALKNSARLGDFSQWATSSTSCNAITVIILITLPRWVAHCARSSSNAPGSLPSVKSSLRAGKRRLDPLYLPRLLDERLVVPHAARVGRCEEIASIDVDRAGHL